MVWMVERIINGVTVDDCISNSDNSAETSSRDSNFKNVKTMERRRSQSVEGRDYSTVHINPLIPELNPSAQRCLTRFFIGILLLELCVSLMYAWKTYKWNNYTFSLLIMYGSFYMFRHYIAILRGVSNAFWEMLNWGAVDRILWMGVLRLVTWSVAISDRQAPRH
jgi:hypothetical protein